MKKMNLTKDFLSYKLSHSDEGKKICLNTADTDDIAYLITVHEYLFLKNAGYFNDDVM